MIIKYKLREDCFCEGYMHELLNYNRPGLVEKKLQKDDIVELESEWTNFYGSYLRVKKDGVKYDIPHNKLKLI